MGTANTLLQVTVECKGIPTTRDVAVFLGVSLKLLSWK